jgi:hypothetical protein
MAFLLLGAVSGTAAGSRFVCLDGAPIIEECHSLFLDLNQGFKIFFFLKYLLQSDLFGVMKFSSG